MLLQPLLVLLLLPAASSGINTLGRNYDGPRAWALRRPGAISASQPRSPAWHQRRLPRIPRPSLSRTLPKLAVASEEGSVYFSGVSGLSLSLPLLRALAVWAGRINAAGGSALTTVGRALVMPLVPSAMAAQWGAVGILGHYVVVVACGYVGVRVVQVSSEAAYSPTYLLSPTYLPPTYTNKAVHDESTLSEEASRRIIRNGPCAYVVAAVVGGLCFFWGGEGGGQVKGSMYLSMHLKY